MRLSPTFERPLLTHVTGCFGSDPACFTCWHDALPPIYRLDPGMGWIALHFHAPPGKHRATQCIAMLARDVRSRARNAAILTAIGLHKTV
ncbi:Uncharacterised protein [Serratia odorifera]|uniref:Uncharacterized protein n=1 Tax=Serratia odorifera TaxID=618 RepID=A0A447KVI5_SEROD|nr:Uncharacterised protein [Serratia odorifera]